MPYTTGFRPLPGDLISQYLSVLMSMKNLQISFRPLPGDLISQYTDAVYVDMSDVVSVPFPGILFLNGEAAGLSDELNAFPSPSRGSYFSILSFTCLILTGFQSRIAVQNQIRLWNKLLSP